MLIGVLRGPTVAGVKMQTKPQPPPGVTLSPLLTIRGREAAHAWLAKALGATVPLETVRKAASARQLRCTKIGRALYFTTQDVFDWFVDNYTAPPANGAQQSREKWYDR